jgi:hypothetical protein
MKNHYISEKNDLQVLENISKIIYTLEDEQ